MRNWVFVLLLLVVWSPVIAVPGAQNAEFQSAVAHWLNGDDENSLPRLAALAQSGNKAARLLLARIERYDKAPSSFISNLEHDKRLSLFRNPQPIGRFYSSWLVTEAREGDTLAQALLDSRKPTVNLALIEQLRALGEYEATDHPIRIASIYGSEQEKQAMLNRGLVKDELVPYVLSFKPEPEIQSDGIEALRLIARGLPGTGSIDAAEKHTRAMARFLALGTPYSKISAGNPWREPFENWLLTSAATRPLVGVCEARCSVDVTAQCATMLFGLTGGYYEVIRLDTPLESVIPQQRFLDSLRVQQMALGRAARTRAETGKVLATIDSLEQESACVADMVRDERSMHPQ